MMTARDWNDLADVWLRPDPGDRRTAARALAGPVDWSTPEGIADAASRFQAMATAAEEMATICRKLARTLTHNHDDEGNPSP